MRPCLREIFPVLVFEDVCSCSLYGRSGSGSDRIRKSICAVNPSRQSSCCHPLRNNFDSTIHSSSDWRRFPDPSRRRSSLRFHHHPRLPLRYFPNPLVQPDPVNSRCCPRRMRIWILDRETSSFPYASTTMPKSRCNLVVRSLSLVPFPPSLPLP